VNKTDPTTFVFRHEINNELTVQICKIAEKTIIIGDVINIDFFPNCYCGRNIYSLEWVQRDEQAAERVKIVYLCLVKGG
jgi:hypothetical protein